MSGVAIWVKGIVGSGKTWLCEELMKTHGIQCYDTDEVMQKLFRDLRESSPNFRQLIRSAWSKNNNWWTTHMNAARKILEDRVREAHSSGHLIVIVGNSIEGNIEGVDKIYFVKMSEKALGIAFRRLLRREISKITTNSERLKDIIDNEELDDIGAMLSNVATPAIMIGTGFKDYKRMYNRELKAQKSKGATILTQPEILGDIIGEE